MRTEAVVHETRIPSLLPSWTCSIRLRGVKTTLKTRSRKNCAQNGLRATTILFRKDSIFSFFINATTDRPPIFLDSKSQPTQKTRLSTWERERKRDSIYRGGCRVISRIFIVRFEELEETSLVKKNRVEKREYATQHANWNPWRWPRASRFYRAVYNHTPRNPLLVRLTRQRKAKGERERESRKRRKNRR